MTIVAEFIGGPFDGELRALPKHVHASGEFRIARRGPPPPLTTPADLLDAKPVTIRHGVYRRGRRISLLRWKYHWCGERAG